MISDCVAIVKLATIMGSDIGLLNYLMSQKGFGRVVCSRVLAASGRVRWYTQPFPTLSAT